MLAPRRGWSPPHAISHAGLLPSLIGRGPRQALTVAYRSRGRTTSEETPGALPSSPSPAGSISSGTAMLASSPFSPRFSLTAPVASVLAGTGPHIAPGGNQVKTQHTGKALARRQAAWCSGRAARLLAAAFVMLVLLGTA